MCKVITRPFAVNGELLMMKEISSLQSNGIDMLLIKGIPILTFGRLMNFLKT